MRLLLAVWLTGASLWGGEYAVLSSGFRLRVERHEVRDAMVRLHVASGTIDLPAAEVSFFEPEEVAPKPETPAVAPPPAPAARVPTPRELLDEAADRHGLPRAFVHSVAKAESAYRADAVSPKGAIGIMQLMPGTASHLGADPKDPRQNVDAGVRLLRELLLKYDASAKLALAAYNAGEGAVGKFNGVPPYRETQSYIQRILREYKRTAGAK